MARRRMNFLMHVSLIVAIINGLTGLTEDGLIGAGHLGLGTDVVAGLLANEVEDVSADVPAAEGVQVPVGFDGGDLGVVVVVVRVLGADEAVMDGVTKEDGEDAVADGVCTKGVSTKCQAGRIGSRRAHRCGSRQK